MSNDSLVPTTDSYALAAELACVSGDLKQLSAQQRLAYYGKVCSSVGLNPYTQPFDYIVLNGKLTLYAKKNATDQIREIKKVSIRIVSKEVMDDVFIVHAEARMPDGRQDEDLGIVALGALKGEFKANAIMKAITKAKRRVTLSICGLGFLDETEVESVPGAQYVSVDPQTHSYAQTDAGTVDTATGEVVTEPTGEEVQAQKKAAVKQIRQAFQARAESLGYEGDILDLCEILCDRPREGITAKFLKDALSLTDTEWNAAIDAAYAKRKKPANPATESHYEETPEPEPTGETQPLMVVAGGSNLGAFGIEQ
jgi:hypothetical protein